MRILLLLTILTLCVVSCARPPKNVEVTIDDIEVTVEEDSASSDNYVRRGSLVDIDETPVSQQTPVSELGFRSLNTVPQDWKTYAAARQREGYTLLGASESAAWLQRNKQNISIKVGSNHQYGLRTVVTLTMTHTTDERSREVTILIVNDDAGNSRVFQK